MELRTTREMRRSEQLSKMMGKKAEGTERAAQAQPPKELKAPADKVTISAQALSYLEEQNRLAWEQDSGGKHGWMEDGKSELDQLSASLKVLERCQKIAASIMKGDRVPPQDLEYLRSNDPDGYKLALALRREKKNPKDCKSVLDGEDKQRTAAEPGGEEPAPAESVGESSGGEGAGAPEE